MSRSALDAPPRPTLDVDVLYRQTRDGVYAYVRSLIRDPHVAEDVVATAYEKAWRKRGSFSPRRGSPQAWIYGIARNAALDRLRQGARRPEAGMEAIALAAADDGDVVTRVAEAERVRAAMARLAPRDRELVALRYWADLAVADIARVTGMSESNVTTRLSRALKALMETMGDDDA